MRISDWSSDVCSSDLHVTHRLRQIRLVGRFAEFFGPGVATLSAGERAVVANMATEYGSSTGHFPVDEATLTSLRETGRSVGQLALVRDTIDRKSAGWGKRVCIHVDLGWGGMTKK